MYNLLIVDDEKHYTDSLVETVPWAEMGIETVYKAYNAAQALEVLRSHQVDIVMTDIRMPQISGLELIEQIRVSWPDIRCLLLTGYADFDFAKKAIELQALDYLLKPVKDEQLMEAMQRILAQVERDRIIEKSLTVYKENLTQLRSQLLMKLLNGDVRADHVSEKLSQYDIQIPVAGSVCLYLIRLGRRYANYDLYSQSLLRFAAANIMEELFRERYDIWWAGDEEGDLVVVVYDHAGSPLDQAWLASRVERFQTEVVRYLKDEVRVEGVGEYSFPEGLKEGYAASKVKMAKASAIKRSEPERTDEEARLMKALYEPPLLTHLLETEQWDEAETKIRALLGLLQSTGSVERLRDVFFFLSNAYLYITNKLGKSLLEMLSPEQAKYLQGKPVLHVHQLELWAIGVLESFREKVGEEPANNNDQIVRKTQEYIANNLDKDLSLTMLAHLVYLHPNYLSKIFKMHTDMTISQYIYIQRMHKASEHLKNSDEKIYEIGVRIGYPNTNWFIKKFKDQFNITPQEYRDRYRLR